MQGLKIIILQKYKWNILQIVFFSKSFLFFKSKRVVKLKIMPESPPPQKKTAIKNSGIRNQIPI